MSIGYVVRRVGLFFLVVWVAASLNFLILRAAPGDPVAGILARLAQQGANVAGSEAVIASYRVRFGLDDPLPVQYVRFVVSFATFDFGPSLSSFPTPVSAIVGRALPWSIGLLATTTVLAFTIGTGLGALLAWHRTPRLARALLPALMALAAVPYYLVAILLLAVFGFGLHLLPVAGTEAIGGSDPSIVGRVGQILYHSFLPALSLIVSGIGGWMLGMRSLLVNLWGSDFLLLAEAKGLSDTRVLIWYAVRNAILPQVTILALTLGTIVSGAVLVEAIFSYPGLGTTLYRAIQNADYTLIEGVTFMLVVGVGMAILLLDLLYPRIDPRVTYGAA